MIYGFLRKSPDSIGLPLKSGRLANYAILQGRHREFSIIYERIAACGLPWSILVTESGEVIGRDFLLNLNPKDHPLPVKAQRLHPKKMIILPVDSKFKDFDKNYVALCQQVIERRNSFGKLPKKNRHAFYRTLIPGFDKILFMERRGRKRISRETYIPNRELIPTAERIQKVIDQLFPGLITFFAIESDLPDFKARVLAEQEAKNLQQPPPKPVQKYRSFDNFESIPSMAYTELISREKQVQNTLFQIQKAKIKIENQYKAIEKPLQLHLKSLRSRDTDAIREALDFALKNLGTFYQTAHFESMLEWLIDVYGGGRWNSNYPIFASDRREIATQFRRNSLLLVAGIFEEAMKKHISIPRSILKSLQECLEYFVDCEEYPVKQAAIRVRIAILNHTHNNK